MKISCLLLIAISTLLPGTATLSGLPPANLESNTKTFDYRDETKTEQLLLKKKRPTAKQLKQLCKIELALLEKIRR